MSELGKRLFKSIRHTWCSSATIGAAAIAAIMSIATAEAAAVEPGWFPSNLSSASDQELTDIAARWSELSAPQRRAVLVETTRRMDSKKRQGSAVKRKGRLSISVQRRYGRGSDGSVVVETRVVQVRPKGTSPAPGARVVASPELTKPGVPAARVNSRIGFGAGFERRRAQGVKGPVEGIKNDQSQKNPQEAPAPAN
jgi:hypothetical protein